jgi:hypothetical protein
MKSTVCPNPSLSILLTLALLALKSAAQDVVSLANGYLSFENPDTNLYYTVEFLPNLDVSEEWRGAYRSLQDIRSGQSTVTVAVGLFHRVVGSATALHTRTLSDATVAVGAGYYETANLNEVDPDLVAGRIVSGTTIFGVAGSAVESSGNATAGQVLSGATFSRAGAAGLTGTMPNIGAQNVMPTTAVQSISTGWHDGSGEVAGDTDLVSGNVRAGVNIFGVDGQPEVVNTSSGDAVSGDLLAGKTVWVDGIEMAGTMPTRLLASTTTVVGAGYYAATNLATADTDLSADNIRAGVNMFGVVGNYDFSGLVAVPATGQTNSLASGDDGDLRRGALWPSPRFTVITSGADRVVNDELTGLMWVRSPHSLTGNSNATNWAPAVAFCTNLSYAGYTDWRLPNVNELLSLLDYSRFNYPLPADHPFTGIQYSYYWTSTLVHSIPSSAWYVTMTYGNTYFTGTDSSVGTRYWVWPVRGGT